MSNKPKVRGYARGYARGECQHWWSFDGAWPGLCPECGAEAYAWRSDRPPVPVVVCGADDPRNECEAKEGREVGCRYAPEACAGEAQTQDEGER